MPSNVLPLDFKQTLQPIIWIFHEGEGDEIKSRLPFKVFSTSPIRIHKDVCSTLCYLTASTWWFIQSYIPTLFKQGVITHHLTYLLDLEFLSQVPISKLWFQNHSRVQHALVLPKIHQLIQNHSWNLSRYIFVKITIK